MENFSELIELFQRDCNIMISMSFSLFVTILSNVETADGSCENFNSTDTSMHYSFSPNAIREYAFYRKNISYPSYENRFCKISHVSAVLNDPGEVFLSSDNYIGLQKFHSFYGFYEIFRINTRSKDLKYNSNSLAYNTIQYDIISNWLMARYSLFVSLLTVLKSCFTIGLLDLQKQLPFDSSISDTMKPSPNLSLPASTSVSPDVFLPLQPVDYQNILLYLDIYRSLLPELVTAVKDLFDCHPISESRGDVFSLCLDLQQDAKIFIKILFDYSCYFPVFNKFDYYQILSMTSSSYQRQISKNDSVKSYMPSESLKHYTKHELFLSISTYYNMITDCRYNFIVCLIHVMQKLSEFVDISPLIHESLFINLIYRAIICSLPAYNIVVECQSLQALFGHHYKFKQLLLSNSMLSLYQKGSGGLLQGIFAVLELSTSADSLPMVSIRERLYSFIKSIKMYVCSKIMASLRQWIVEKYNRHDLSCNFDSLKVADETIDYNGTSSSQYSGSSSNGIMIKVLNLYACRYDTLGITTALHSLLRSMLSQYYLSNNLFRNVHHSSIVSHFHDCDASSFAVSNQVSSDSIQTAIEPRVVSKYFDIINAILKELEAVSKPRMSSSGKCDIRVYIPDDKPTIRSLNASDDRLLLSNDASSTISYLMIHENFLGCYNTHLKCIGKEFLDLSAEVKRNVGIMSDPVEELGKRHLSIQSLLDLYTHQSVDYFNPNNGKLDPSSHSITSEHNDNSTVNDSKLFKVEENLQLLALEQEHSKIRQTITNMCDVGDWESAFLLTDKVISTYQRKIIEINNILNQSDANTTSSFDPYPNMSKSKIGKSKEYLTFTNYLLYRYSSLSKELSTSNDNVRLRILQDGDFRVFPCYYAIRFNSDDPWSISNNCIQNKIFKDLNMLDFLEATNLKFYGINTFGSPTSFAKHKDVQDNERTHLGALHSNDLDETEINEMKEEMFQGRDKSLDGLGQGTWCILRYDPTAYIATSRIYKRYSENESKMKEDNTLQETFGCFVPMPVPPPSYQAVLTKVCHILLLDCVYFVNNALFIS